MGRRGTLGAALAIAAALSSVSQAGAQPAIGDPSPVPAPAPPTSALARPLMLDDVLRSADRAHPLIVAAAQERPLAEADVQSAEGAFDVAWRTRAVMVPLGGYPSGRVDSMFEKPTTLWGSTLFAGYRWGSDTFAPYDGKLVTNEFGEVRAGLLVPVWRNGPVDRRRATIERSELGLAIADATVSQQKLEIARLAAFRYWDWVAAGKRLRAAKEVLELAQLRDAQLGARVERGDLPMFEQIDNRRAIVHREQQVVLAQRQLEQASIELALFFRDDDGSSIRPSPERLPPDFPEPGALPGSFAGDLQGALERRPELDRLRAQREQTQVEERWADNQRMPAIDFAVMGSQDLGQGSEKRDPFELELGLVIDIPIERNVADGRVRAAQAQRARVDAQERFAIDRVEADVRDASVALVAAHERVRIARQEVTLAHQLETGERERFELGDSSLLIVNLREQAALEAEVRVIDALADYHKARAALDAATARLLERPAR
jgi:outer membrane protein TolC